MTQFKWVDLPGNGSMDCPGWTTDARILDLVQEAIFACDRDLNITFWNRASAELYGWSETEALGRNVGELLLCDHPLTGEKARKELYERGAWQGEIPRTTKSGFKVLVDVTWAVRRDAAGEIIEMIETGRDITLKRKNEEAKKQSDLRYRSLLNNMPMAVWQLESGTLRVIFDRLRADGVTNLSDHIAANPDFVSEALELLQVSEVNEEAARMLGAKDRSELLGPYSILWSDREGFAEAICARFAGAQSFGGLSKLDRLDGGKVDILWRSVFSDELTEMGLVLIGAIDVTEQRESVEKLAKSETLYRNLFQHMPMSLWQIDTSDLNTMLRALRDEGVTDLDAYIEEHPDFLDTALANTRIGLVNHRTVSTFGGQKPADFVGPANQYWQANPDTFRRSLVARYSGAESYTEETRVRTLDGRDIDIVYTSVFSPALSELGMGLVGTIDIGDRVDAERRLQQARADFAHAARVATLGELAASIAHEVNQPLAAIATNGEASLRWLGKPEPNVEEVRILAARMVADARRAAEIIARIRRMAAHRAPETELLSVNDIIDDAMQFLRREFQDHGIKTSLVLAVGLPQVRSDRTQLQQVVVNLLVNASQAMADQPASHRHLVVRTKSARGEVMVEIEDSGGGVPEENRRQLFDSFFTTKKDGLGIGLSICRSIIEAHGGEIRCEHLSAGTRFTFGLPCAG